MALSVLRVPDTNPQQWGLWCSVRKTWILQDRDMEAVYGIKEIEERAEQQKDDREHLLRLYREYFNMLREAGKSEGEAAVILSKTLPSVHTDELHQYL